MKSILYDALAPVYGRFIPRMVERTIFRAVQRVSAGSPGSLLEVAVGPGSTIPLLGEKLGDTFTVAMDVSGPMLRLARKEVRKSELEASLVQGNAVHLPFADASFDAVLSSFLMDVVRPRELEAALGEMVRVLAPGGRITIAQLNVQSGLVRTAWKATYAIFPGVVGHASPDADVSGLFKACGLRILLDEEIDEAVGTRVTTLMKVRG